MYSTFVEVGRIVGFEIGQECIYGVGAPIVRQPGSVTHYRVCPDCQYYEALSPGHMQLQIDRGLLIMGLDIKFFAGAAVLYTEENWPMFYPPLDKHEWLVVSNRSEEPIYFMIKDYQAAREHLGYWEEVDEE